MPSSSREIKSMRRIKKALESRIRVIDGLKRNQVSPIVALDLLGEAIERTQYVWLSQLEQNNAILSMTGTATSLNAIGGLPDQPEKHQVFPEHRPRKTRPTPREHRGNFSFAEVRVRSPNAAAFPAAGGERRSLMAVDVEIFHQHEAVLPGRHCCCHLWNPVRTGAGTTSFIPCRTTSPISRPSLPISRNRSNT